MEASSTETQSSPGSADWDGKWQPSLIHEHKQLHLHLPKIEKFVSIQANKHVGYKRTHGDGPSFTRTFWGSDWQWWRSWDTSKSHYKLHYRLSHPTKHILHIFMQTLRLVLHSTEKIEIAIRKCIHLKIREVMNLPWFQPLLNSCYRK